MSAHTSGFTPALAGRRTDGHVSVISRVMARVAAWQERRAVAAELSGLSARELADIGLTRDELPLVFDPTFARSYAARGSL